MFNKIKCRVGQFLTDESGPTAVEYAVMLALIVVGAIAAVLTAGDFQRLLWVEMATDIGNATGNP